MQFIARDKLQAGELLARFYLSTVPAIYGGYGQAEKSKAWACKNIVREALAALE
jgi:hypothetical protein